MIRSCCNTNKIIALCLGLLFSISSFAQVVKSEEKTVVNDVEYYVHKVKLGETLYSLSAAYELSQREIVMANPILLTTQIKVGQTLYLPVLKGINIPMEDNAFIYHVIKQGETLSSLSRQYNTTVRTLEDQNPEVKVTPLQINQVIRIPKAGAIQPAPSTQVAEEIPDKVYETHTVKSRETLYSVARRYGMTTNQILALNPEINSRNPSIKVGQEIKIREIETQVEYMSYTVLRRETLQAIATKFKVSLNSLLDLNPTINPANPAITEGQIIKIPIEVGRKVPGIELPIDYSKMDTIIIKPTVDNEEENENNTYASISSNQSDYSKKKCDADLPNGKIVRIAFLVPLYFDSEQNKSIISGVVPDNSSEQNQLPNTIDQRSIAGMELCQGAIVAAKTLESKGINVQLSFYDTSNNTAQVNRVLASPELERMDIIVGPFFSDLLAPIAQFCSLHNIYLVSPVSRISGLNDNSLFFQLLPSDYNSASLALNYIRQQISNGKKITLLTDIPEVSSSVLYKELKQQMDSQLAGQFKALPLTAMSSSIKADSTFQHEVIALTSSEAYTMQVLSQLNVLYRNGIDIQTIGLPSWRDFSTIDIEYFHNLEYTYLTPFFTDYNNSELISFLNLYRSSFASEPSAKSSSGYVYGYMGYDLVNYFAQAIAYYGKPFEYCMEDMDITALQSDFSFVRNNNNPGFINTNSQFAKYTRDIHIVAENNL